MTELTKKTDYPWGRAAALLAASLATLLGIAKGVEPDMILWRSFLAAIIVGIVVRIAIWLISDPSHANA